MVYEVELFKADIETELFECSNFNELWQSFSAKPIIEKATKEIDCLNIKKELVRLKRLKQQQEKRLQTLEKKELEQKSPIKLTKQVIIESDKIQLLKKEEENKYIFEREFNIKKREHSIKLLENEILALKSDDPDPGKI